MSEEKNCVDMFDILTICEGDKIELVLRGSRGMVSIRGIVLTIGNNAMVVQSRNGKLAIRYSEIKMVKKVEK